jgi:hypothetical protein
MNKLVLQLIETTPSMDSSPQVQNLIKDQTQSLLALFQEKEISLSRDTKAPSWEATQLTRVTKLIYELVNSLEALEDSTLSQLSWLTPMLSKCMSNETVRQNVHKLQQRMMKLKVDDEGPDAAVAESAAAESEA